MTAEVILFLPDKFLRDYGIFRHLEHFIDKDERITMRNNLLDLFLVH